MAIVKLTYDLNQERDNGEMTESIDFKLTDPSYSHKGCIKKGYEDYMALRFYLRSKNGEMVRLLLNEDDPVVQNRKAFLEAILKLSNSDSEVIFAE